VLGKALLRFVVEGPRRRMMESERLQKIVDAQGKELSRLRKLLSQARVCQVDYFLEDETLRIIVTCIGVDEYHFLEKLKPELEAVANALVGQVNAVTMDPCTAVDVATGEKAEGRVLP
jgi:DNA-binding IclR family transcriptional regulator